MGKYKISVIVPVYNKEKYLKECIESILQQTLSNIEIVIVDDGSKDESINIAKEYAKKNENIKLISQENQGVISARITGYKNASGEYIAWVDADDFIEENMYEKLYTKAIETDSDIAICKYDFYPYTPSKKNIWYENYNGKVDYKFLKKSSLQVNKIVKKELLEKVNLIDLFERIGESCYTIVILNTDKIVTIDEALYHYRVGHESLSTNYKNCDWYEGNIVKAKNKVELIKGTKFEKEWTEYFEYLVFYSILLMLIVAINSGRKDIYRKYKKEIEQKKYKKNRYKKKALIESNGKLKTFVLLHLVIKHYYLSMPIVKIFLKRR